MQNQNEFVLKVNDEEYIVSDSSLILLENITNKTKMIMSSQAYKKLSEEVKNKFILENIGN